MKTNLIAQPGISAVRANHQTRRYQQRRQSDREATIGVTDSLVHLFANRWAPLVVGRNIGLMTMELFTPARDVLAQRTLGWVAR